MNAKPTFDRTSQEAGHRGPPQLRTILLTDLVDSTALVERVGDGAAAELFRAHDRLVLQLQNQWRGRLIDRSDGLLLLFERPVDGLGFALDYFRGLRELGAPHDADIKARAGLHVGEVLSWRNSDEAVRVGAKPVEVEGLAKPMAARLMTMARPGQLLMSAVAEPLAHRSARELGERGQHLVWKSHGRWRLKGVPEPQQIFEVGEPGITPLRAPQNGPKAWRDLPLWRRPAAMAAELALVALIGVSFWIGTRPQPAIAFNQRDWVVVADLRNLTDQPLLDDSLEQAFRISLKQSRHVNVLSDLKTRQTLERMRLPVGAELDRATASEIALRDGARAVILPTVAEIGGQLRVSAELIDPHSQTTVYSGYADGQGVESVLGSIDQVTASLRNEMGESLEVVRASSAPLPKVATNNLHALRAYALGMNAFDGSRFPTAMEHLERAVELDPQFALAYLGMGLVSLTTADEVAAKAFVDKAMALREHLPTRERLTVEALAAAFGPQAEQRSAKAWRTLAAMYPDDFTALDNHAWMAFATGDYDAAHAAALSASSRQNPMRASALSRLGRTQLAREKYADAIRSFSESEAISGAGPTRQHVEALAAQRLFTEADAMLERINPSVASIGLISKMDGIALLVDSGRWRAAIAAASQASREAKEIGGLLELELAFVELAARTLRDPHQVDTSDYQRVFDQAADAASDAKHPNRSEFAYIALATLYLVQRRGEPSWVSKALSRITAAASQSDDSRTRQLLGIVEAGQQLQDQPDAAVAKLQSLLDGHELFQTHVALRNALRANGDLSQVLVEDHWIASRRGLAYAEPAGAQALMVLNIADTNLALLDAAELHHQSGEHRKAQTSLEEFQRVWPKSTWPDYLRRRVGATFPESKVESQRLNVKGASR